MKKILILVLMFIAILIYFSNFTAAPTVGCDIYLDGVGAEYTVIIDGNAYTFELKGYESGTSNKAYLYINGKPTSPYGWNEGENYTVTGTDINVLVKKVEITYTDPQTAHGKVHLFIINKECIERGCNIYLNDVGAGQSVIIEGTTYTFTLKGYESGTPNKAYLYINSKPTTPYGWNEGETYQIMGGIDVLVKSVEIIYIDPQTAKANVHLFISKECAQGYICGNGMCEIGETYENCPQDCEKPKCPVMIDLAFNKYEYYPSDYFEVIVKIYDEYKNLIPNQMFNVYNVREGQTSTFYTDSTGIYRSASTIPSDPKYNGEWTFITSVTREGCPYISDEETIYLNIAMKCGDGFCDESEKELMCETVCSGGESPTGIAPAATATGAMTATTTYPTQTLRTCIAYCHVRCPDDCTPNCGNGVCDAKVCEYEGCPIPENEKNCPQDCKPVNYCGSKSTDPNCICQDGYIKEKFEAPCDIGETTMCIYYRCIPAYRELYLSTDKYIYNLNEPVNIYTNPVELGYLNVSEIEVSVRNPYGTTQAVTLKPLCETTEELCPVCEPGYYCRPCEPKTLCKYTGTFTGTNTIGSYFVSSTSSRADLMIRPTSFRVYDYSLLEKYLILRDIDGYIYKDAQVSPGPENFTAYMAAYEKDLREYAAVVADFGTRENLEKFLNQALSQFSPREKKVDGYYIYVFETYGQKVYIWTYKTFFAGIMEYAQITAPTGVAKPIPVEPPTKPTISEAIVIEEEEIAESKDFLTGMVITGMPAATTPVYCGMDSLQSECICGGDEVKERFTPCKDGVCETHYRCIPPYPEELIKAYLNRYPSDIKTTGTECEGKGGYCIGIESYCKPEFEETGFACKTISEKCCVRRVIKDDFLEIVMKLEGIRVRMDKLERHSRALSDYYESVGDDERAEKFSEVADMFAHAKDMIDDIIAKIRENLDNLEAIRSEVKDDIYELRVYIRSILEKMVS